MRTAPALRLAGGALASAALLAAAAWLPSPAHLLAFVALVPWLRAQDGAGTPAAALAGGLLLSVAYSALPLGWFAGAAASYTGAPAPLVWLALALAGPLVAPQTLLAALARHLAGGPGAAGRARAAAALALAWAGADLALPKLLGDTLGLALWPAPLLRQAADLGGAAGLTALLLAANELALAALRAAAAARGRVTARLRAAARPALALALLAAGWAGYGALRLRAAAARPARPTIVAGVVQPALAAYDRRAREVGTYAVVREAIDVHRALSRRLVDGGADLLVWPETVYPTTFGAPRSPEGVELDAELEAFARAAGVPLVFGAYEAEGGREYVAAFVIGGGPRASYRKAHLFPLTEAVPAWLDGPRVRAALPWLGTWTPGPGARVLAVPVAGRALRLAPLVCYDAVRPGHAAAAARAGAELLVALSNDAWFEGGPGARLHLAAAVFRAIETRLPLVRATTTGVSGLVDATGEVRLAAGPGRRAALALEVAPGAPLAAPFPAIAGALGPAALALAAALAAAGLRASRRRGAAPARRTAVPGRRPAA